jgi:hypothetical protein
MDPRHELEALMRVKDPADRYREADRLIEATRVVAAGAFQAKRTAVGALRNRGLSYAEIGAELGISRQRAFNIHKSQLSSEEKRSKQT